jgi:hypothetical protein
MERARATIYAVAAALVALLLLTVAYGLGAGEAVLVVGLAATPVVMLTVYWQLRRSRP